MKSTIATTLATTLALLGLSTAAALPAPQDAPIVRVLPPNWAFKISSLKGPGCPDFETMRTDTSVTRLTYGQNTMDGSEIYYWFAAYPAMRASVDDDNDGYTWCETELDYEEYSDWDKKKKGEGYRFRLHKNGTKVIATYDLEKGTKAEWKITYDAGKGKKITDKVEVAGPYSPGQYQQEKTSPVDKSPSLYKLPECGSGKIKFKVELTVSGKKGYAASEMIQPETPEEHYYGSQIGWSYDWEHCVTSDW